MAAGEEDFCENYLLLKPEKASSFDLLRILCSDNLDKGDCFNTGDESGLVGFGRRWIVFVSLLLQKILLVLKNPLAMVGSLIELCLNYPAFNGGYRHFFFNLFTGRSLVRPDKSSATFTSVIGNLDKRWDLENRNIDEISSNYNSNLAMMASKLSYENESFARNVVTHHWQMEFLGFYIFWNDYQGLQTTNAIMFIDRRVNPNLIVVAFRGTEPFDADDWRTNIDVSWYELPAVGKIHGGFMKALGLQKSSGWPKRTPPASAQKPFAYYTIRDKLKPLIHEHGNARLIVTGHSLGGALAILFAGVLAMHEEEMVLDRVEGVYTFGQPRVGNEQFGEYMEQKMKVYDVKYLRFVYSNDIVPRLPYDNTTFMFKHFGPCFYFNSCYQGQILKEEPNKNYFSLFSVVPKFLNSVYELIRSFLLPWTKGGEYKEGWLMKVFRVEALLTPGLVDHFPPDYVNVTRLGKLTMLPSSIHQPDQFQPNESLKHE